MPLQKPISEAIHQHFTFSSPISTYSTLSYTTTTTFPNHFFNMQSLSPSQQTTSDDNQEQHIQFFIQDFLSHRTTHSPSTSLHYAITNTNIQAASSGHSFVFNQSLTNRLDHQQQLGAHQQQSRLSIISTATKVQINKFLSIVPRFVSRISEIEFSPRACAMKISTEEVDDSIYIEYIQSRTTWRVAIRPSGIILRPVEEMELTNGCQQLISIAGCRFKTSTTTPHQICTPLEIPSRSLGSLMHSFKFFTAHNGSWYRVYSSCIGRAIKVTVTIVPIVEYNGNNRCEELMEIQENSLLARIEVLDNRSVTGIVHRLRVQSDNSLITRYGQEVVGKKFSGNNSIILL